MILLKANAELKTVFHKIVKTMGENVNWAEIFIINNNELILLGKGRSWFFNFDDKRAYSNFMDVDINEDVVDQITENEQLENTLNMTLYTFGKWGQIKGLKVEKDYDQLNKLLNYILQEIEVEAVLTKDNLRFYKEGIQITYEEIIQIILEKSKSKEGDGEEINEDSEDKNDVDSLGLWHKIVWKSNTFSFVKEELSDSDRTQSRLGNDFYMVNYKCPVCGEKLYMVVYPTGEEFRIETDEGGVYLARAYTCKGCNSFYTPKPNKLLMEGDVYSLSFDDDKIAYEDYLELMGRQGERTSNINFNQYEAEYNKKIRKNQEGQENQDDLLLLDEIGSDVDSMTTEQLEELKDKMDSGFYSEENLDKFQEVVEEKLKIKRSEKNDKNQDSKLLVADELGAQQEDELSIFGEKENRSKKESRSGKEKTSKRVNSNKKENSDGIFQKQNELEMDINLPTFEGSKEILNAISKGDQDWLGKVLEKISPNHLTDLKILIQADQDLNEKQKKDSINIIDRYLYKENEKKVLEKAVSCKGKNYAKIESVIEEIKKEELAESVKTSILNSLKELLEKTGKKELEHIISQIPENISKKQYKLVKDKIEEYKKLDHNLYIEYLDEKRDAVEKQEITAFIKRVNPRDRQSHLNLYNKLKEQNFEEKNTIPYLEKIYDKVVAMDEAAIRKVCPDPAEITFEEGLEAYEAITLGEFLPELKADTLGMIEKRLTKLKMDECDQLVNKLSKEMSQFLQEDSRIYFNNVRKMLRGNLEDTESIIINNALNTFAIGRGKYEFPILTCDTSYSRSGERGFVLTANHIFYNGILNNGVIDVMDVDSIFAGNGILQKGIYIIKDNGDKVKISNSLKTKELKAIAKVLNDFVGYLKEKPESRKISYMAKEVHKVKCCYRCGFVFKEGLICPKCGSKYNE